MMKIAELLNDTKIPVYSNENPGIKNDPKYNYGVPSLVVDWTPHTNKTRRSLLKKLPVGKQAKPSSSTVFDYSRKTMVENNENLQTSTRTQET
ncbi:MAG: hypothetical protein DDT31_00230 [Syntrophomonadaceae bacterium]|nr:hypothetical protein [Bacillota bacterium]